MRFSAYFLVFSCLLTGSVFGTGKSYSENKVHINAEQLFIDQEGMYCSVGQETLIPITGLFHDENGFSILKKDLETLGAGDRYECPNGHKAPLGRGRCNNPNCPHFAGR